MARELKEEGDKLFQRRDYERALLNYEKAIKLLPRAAHPDAAYLHNNIAACYMQTSPPDYHRAVNECNMALEASPEYTKALLNRARCFAALGRFDLARRDANKQLESNRLSLRAVAADITAPGFAKRLEKAVKEKGFVLEGIRMSTLEDVVDTAPEELDQKQKTGEAVKEVKLVFGELPATCSMAQVCEAILNEFPGMKAVLVKHKDKEDDLVTITNQEELKWPEEFAEPGTSLRLYVTEADPELEPYVEDGSSGSLGRDVNGASDNYGSTRSNRLDQEFARQFKNHVKVTSDEYSDLHEVSMKLYNEAVVDTITAEEAQEEFQLAECNVQEMAALALHHRG